MLAKKCDRCGKFYELYTEKSKCRAKDVNGIAFVHICTNGDYSGTKSDGYDLCPECLNAVIDFVNGGTKNAED